MTTERPKYAELADQLRREIEDGTYPPGAQLPSEPELAARAGISRTSVRNAIAILRSSGLVMAKRGSGVFVRPRLTRIVRDATQRYRHEKLMVHRPEFERRGSGTLEQDTGVSLSAATFSAEITQDVANSDLAAVFGVPEGTPLVKRVFHQSPISDSGSPIRLGASWLLASDVEKNPDIANPSLEPWPGGTQHQLSTIGIELDRITDIVTARPPTPTEAAAFRIDEGVSVITIRKISVSTDNRVVEVADIVLPGDRTELRYDVELPRWE